MKRLRQIVKIDEEKCDGCGLCIPACQEGALQIVDGKARLVKDIYCDGLGACLGHCPQDAITLEEREAEEFDEEAVKAYLEDLETEPSQCPVQTDPLACGCPGSTARSLESKEETEDHPDMPSELLHWPVQLALVPSGAPYLKGADLLVVADCVPFAYPNFHRDFLKGHALVVGCPKLDDSRLYSDKLTAIIKEAEPRSIRIAHMEVPCCFGLGHLVKKAVARSGKQIPLKEVTVTIEGNLR